MKYSSIFSMLSFFILFACNETAVYGSDENIIFMRYVEKLHLDKYSVKNTVKTETMAIQLAEIYVRYRYGERIAEEEKPYLITELPDSWVVEGAKLPYEVAGGVFICLLYTSDAADEIGQAFKFRWVPVPEIKKKKI
ncbi:NTF2 fold immunity protein [Escherichia coli]|uniref:NTF2 fold immunity protein n=16 Tax=Gammaproteobacteria TaxID=1236 RepID=UPI001FCECC6A|nr:NTF2 fold immunity protein [Escherichia coli]